MQESERPTATRLSAPASKGGAGRSRQATRPPDGEAEDQWLERLCAGDEAACEWLVRTHAGRMLAVARRILRSEADAQDALQSAFLAAFRAIDRFEGGAQLSTWLHRIVVNSALMKLRSRARHPEVPLEELGPTFLEDGHHAHPPAEWKATPQELLEREQTRRRVNQMIDRLPEPYRAVLLLRDIEGLDTRQTAELLGISQDATKMRLHRARIALRELLDPLFRELR